MIDLTHPLADAWTYPGDPPVGVTEHATHAADGHRVTRLSMGTHAGTHVDAPAHTEPDGATLGAFPVERFRWTARRVDCTDLGAREAVPPDRLPTGDDLDGVDCLVVHTGWAEHWPDERYRDHPHLAPETARRCADRGLDVAVDAPSVDPTPPVERTGDRDVESHGPETGGDGGGPHADETEGDGLAAHHALLGSGRLVVENLRNLDATPRRFQLQALPLAVDADAAPVRAVAVLTG